MSFIPGWISVRSLKGEFVVLRIRNTVAIGGSPPLEGGGIDTSWLGVRTVEALPSDG